MRAAVYCKSIVGSSSAAQEVKLRRLCQQRCWAVTKVYVDPPDSLRKRTSKSARISLIDDLLHRKYDVVLTWKLELLGTDDLLWVLNEVHVKKGVQIVAVAPGYEIDTAAGDGAATKVIAALAKV